MMAFTLDFIDESVTLPIVFCNQCGSHLVDINHWLGRDKALIECSECTNTAIVEGFTVGRIRSGTPDQLAEAQKDRAKPRSNIDAVLREFKPGLYE